MQHYYVVKLAAERLQACYDLAPPRVKAYLEAEVDFVLQKTSSSMVVLELGCGYGRVLRRLIPQVRNLGSEFAGRLEYSLASITHS